MNQSKQQQSGSNYRKTAKLVSVYMLSGLAVSLLFGALYSPPANSGIEKNYLLQIGAALCSGLFFLSIKTTLKDHSLESKFISLLTFSLVAVLLNHRGHDTNIFWAFLPAVVLGISMCFLTTKLLTEDISLAKQVSLIIATAMMIVLINAGLTKSWDHQSHRLLSVQFISLVLTFVVPVASYLWLSHRKSKEINSKKRLAAVVLLIKSSLQHKVNFHIGIAFLSVTLIAILGHLNNQSKLLPLASQDYSYMLYLIPLTTLLFIRSIESINYSRMKEITYSFANFTEKRFLNRHIDNRISQAVNTASRTCSFSIDHDPDQQIAKLLPKTLQYIRAKEIEKCIQTIAEDKFLTCQEKDHFFVGSIDPERSLRPCVDALLMFACIHLDAVSTIEKRLIGLLDLLPVLDPSLVEQLPKNFHSVLKDQSPWLYQLHHCWVDQQMVHTEGESSYHISQGLDAQLDSKDINTLLKNKLGRASTFIWISPQARARLLIEAPMLRTIIHDHLFQTSAGEEVLVFLIKLEDLIPRLQKFYDLNRIRSRLKDFEPTADSLRFIQLLELQMINDTNISNIQKILSHISEYPWYGFKEKDLALQVIKKCYLNGISILELNDNAENRSKLKEKLREATFNATTQVGYPSKLLHRAQIEKWAVRDQGRLIHYATRPKSPRHHEAWIMLATCDAEQLSQNDITIYLKFLSSVTSNRQLKQSRFVLNKAIQSAVNLLQPNQASHAAAGEELFVQFAQWIIHANADIDSCILFLDAWAVLKKRFNKDPQIPSDLKQALSSYFASLCDRSETTQGLANSLFYRWKNIDSGDQKKARLAS